MAGVEFALVVGPFLMLVFGIMKIGIIFFAMFALDNAVEQTARLVRTGQAGTIIKSQFKDQVCLRVPSFIGCSSALRVDVQSNPDLTQITPPTGLDGSGNLAGDGDFTYTPGSGGDYVLVTAFFKWTSIPFDFVVDVGNMGDGSMLMRSVATFRNEPF